MSSGCSHFTFPGWSDEADCNEGEAGGKRCCDIALRDFNADWDWNARQTFTYTVETPRIEEVFKKQLKHKEFIGFMQHTGPLVARKADETNSEKISKNTIHTPKNHFWENRFGMKR